MFDGKSSKIDEIGRPDVNHRVMVSTAALKFQKNITKISQFYSQRFECGSTER
jgi:hypothetical protein